ncbi:MAG TPA: tetratricopeptide repeat protein, partial [Pyrinomonadaceae bacterium]|nr:tetratricopeptide repeat protein [Pyrinomonadaceae bacterium]
LTITVARGEEANIFSSAQPRPVELTQTFAPVPPPTDQLQPSGPIAPPTAHPPDVQPQPAPPAGKPRARYLWFVAAAASLFLLLVTVAAIWLGVGYFRRRETPPASAEAVAPAPDPRQLSEEKAAEAESLLAGGDLDGAIARLREATTVDPANTKALRRLGDLLLDNGRRREAIEAFRALAERDPRDAEAWRSLARAQLDETLFADAAESFRRLVALGGTTALNDNELLSYAEALRLSGKPEEARAFYERLSTSTFADVASSARQRLSELASAQASPASSPDPQRDARAQAAGQPASQPFLSPSPQQPPPAQATPTPPPARVEPTPAPAHTAAEHFARGEQLWSSNRQQALGEFRSAAAKGNTDAYYYLGLAIVQGRDPGSLQRAELVMALQYFQNARRGGRFRAESQRYEDQLGREFDRRRR